MAFVGLNLANISWVSVDDEPWLGECLRAVGGGGGPLDV